MLHPSRTRLCIDVSSSFGHHFFSAPTSSGQWRNGHFSSSILRLKFLRGYNPLKNGKGWFLGAYRVRYRFLYVCYFSRAFLLLPLSWFCCLHLAFPSLCDGAECSLLSGVRYVPYFFFLGIVSLLLFSSTRKRLYPQRPSE